jgi:hypothetical protein
MRNGSRPAALVRKIRRRSPMRSNSGGGKSSNNTGNPALEEAQEAKGVSGNAVHGNKLNDATPKRGATRMKSP